MPLTGLQYILWISQEARHGTLTPATLVRIQHPQPMPLLTELYFLSVQLRPLSINPLLTLQDERDGV